MFPQVLFDELHDQIGHSAAFEGGAALNAACSFSSRLMFKRSTFGGITVMAHLCEVSYRIPVQLPMSK